MTQIICCYKVDQRGNPFQSMRWVPEIAHKRSFPTSQSPAGGCCMQKNNEETEQNANYLLLRHKPTLAPVFKQGEVLLWWHPPYWYITINLGTHRMGHP